MDFTVHYAGDDIFYTLECNLSKQPWHSYSSFTVHCVLINTTSIQFFFNLHSNIRVNIIRVSMPVIKLTYFDFRARAEPARLILAQVIIFLITLVKILMIFLRFYNCLLNCVGLKF